MPTRAKQLNDCIWVWGGPTPSWGGSMDNDCAAKGADYFGARNVMYVYGPHTDEWLEPLRGYDRVYCHLGPNCRTPGAMQQGDIVEEAEALSRLALRYPNIAGAIIDDFDIEGNERFTPARLGAVRAALRAHRSDLQLAVVVYTRNDHATFASLLPFIDVVTMWVWEYKDLPKLDDLLTAVRRDFPGKPLFMGVFIHNYSIPPESATPVDQLAFQLGKAREYIGDGRLQGMIILGDREIAKHPAEAEFVRGYLAEHFGAEAG